MKKMILVTLLSGLVVTLGGCFGNDFSNGQAKSRYKCSKCGQGAFMISPKLEEQPCPEGGKHDWRYNF